MLKQRGYYSTRKDAKPPTRSWELLEHNRQRCKTMMTYIAYQSGLTEVNLDSLRLLPDLFKEIRIQVSNVMYRTPEKGKDDFGVLRWTIFGF